MYLYFKLYLYLYFYLNLPLGKQVWQDKQTPHCNFPYLRAICTHVTPYNTLLALQIIRFPRLQSISKCASSICRVHQAQWSQGGWIEIRTLSAFFSRVKFAAAWQKVLVFNAAAEEKARVNQILCQTAPLRPFKVSLRPFKFVKKNLITACLVGGWVGWIGFQGLNLW